MCASYLEVFVDHGRNLSVTDESFFHQGLLLFQTNSVLEVEVHDDLFQGRCISCFKKILNKVLSVHRVQVDFQKRFKVYQIISVYQATGKKKAIQKN